MELIDKIQRTSFKMVLENKGYVFFSKGLYNLNIIGIRRSVSGNKVTNAFDDYLVVIYITKEGLKKKIFSITTEPGLYHMKNKGNAKGTAILVPGQYRGAFKIGKHQNKYEALVQAKPLPVYRDNNYDDVYNLKPKSIDSGLFGINIHRSNEFTISTKVDKWSAGCQVFANPKDFTSFMAICRLQAKTYGNSFTYTLIEETDL